MNIHDIMQMLSDKHGSDIHIKVGMPPHLRVDGQLLPIEGTPKLSSEQAEALIIPLLSAEQKEFLAKEKELDFGYQFREVGRFRINVYHQQGTIAAAFRLIPTEIKTLDELSMPTVLHEFTHYRQGLILVTGPTGEGKSTTLAAMIDEINHTRNQHILTIEDPIEFIYKSDKSIISQREMHLDTLGWEIALRSALRQDPDVVLVGEMRDYETIAAAITTAETGHLVFATLHTSTAAQTIDRIVDVFPAHQQAQIRQQLASTIVAVLSQRLIPRTNGGRVAACEIMIANGAIRNLIREAKTHQIDTVIQTSAASGMMLIENHLLTMVQQGVITATQAREYAFRLQEMDRLLGGN